MTASLPVPFIPAETGAAAPSPAPAPGLVSSAPISGSGLKVALWQPPASLTNRRSLAAKLDTLRDRLRTIAGRHARAKLASSLSPEDMLLTDILWRDLANETPAIGVFTLETGRLPAETLQLLHRVKEIYGRSIEVFSPDARAVETFERTHGAYPFYESLELRKACCALRKVRPLERALAHADAWLTGQRREQSATREDLPLEERDDARNLAKYNPLADWSEREVWTALRDRAVPVNALHERGYPSIGCDPCTCPVKAGQDPRSGRWWWESRDTKECGLHLATAP